MNYQRHNVLITYPAVRNLTIAVNLLTSTLTPAEANPFVPSVQNNPIKIKLAIQDWKQDRPQYYVDNQPFNQFNWPNPIIREFNLTGFSSNAITAEVASPFVPVIFDNPGLKKQQNKGFERPRPFYFVEPGDPIVVNLFPNPLIKVKKNPDWIDRAPFHQLLGVFPNGSSSLALPVLRLKGKPQDITQARPHYYVEPTAIPTALNNPNPLRKRRNDTTFISTRRPDPIIPGPPFRQNDWPKPLRKKIIAEEFEFHYITDNSSTEPVPGQQTLVVPSIKKRSAITWLQSINISIADPGAPRNVVLFPNPIRIKRPTHVLTNNLIQTPFDIQPGEKPFFEDKWPLPLRAKVIHPQGWQWDKRFYYVEPPIQIGQFDWPVYRPLKRSLVGYIDYRIGESNPISTQVTFVPQREILVPKDWIDNPLKTIIAPTGDTPFNQKDWPLFLRKRFAFEILQINGQDYIILPQVRGRAICLLSAITIYDILSAIDAMEFESREDEYEINSGGSDCQ